MHIVFSANTSYNVYNFRLGLVRALREKKYRVTVVAPEDDTTPLLTREGCGFVPVRMDSKGTHPLKDFAYFRRLLKIYKTLRPDVLLHATVKPNIYGNLAARFAKIPCINNVSGLGTAFIRENIISKLVRALYKISFKTSAKVFFQNPDDRQLFLERKLVRKEITELLPGSGVDIHKFKAEYRLPEDRFVFLLVARLLRDKGIQEYAEAAAAVKKQESAAEFLLLGSPDFESKYGISKEYLNSVTEAGIVTYLGATNDVIPFVEQAHCVVLPSYREGTPRSLTEAASMGRPLVATDVPGCREVVQDGVNGFLCRAADSDDLADAMLRMCRSDGVALRRMSENSRKIAEEKFDEKIVIEKYVKAIEEISKRL